MSANLKGIVGLTVTDPHGLAGLKVAGELERHCGSGGELILRYWVWDLKSRGFE
jgi:hypothetical protein